MTTPSSSKDGSAHKLAHYLAVATFVLNDWGLAVFVALPAVWGYRAIHAT